MLTNANIVAVVAGDYMYVDGGALMLVDDHGNFEKQECTWLAHYL